ncbi:hypothetical protein MWU61_16345 [Loktanella sp. F6476L]|uniref:PglD-related sugar-binding protein n=1 Tax=Loktanella sp. F6476L TaxID=2926405 RepID=UPI001FF61F56|nr:DapH/DapD/GlmU-related protein [Loktanella sp. F6476L]MCK0122124.1 hypothetical protein [Loktanella sp. F6476L]
MRDKPLVIIGGGGHACVVAEAAVLSGWTIIGHIAPEAGSDPLLGVWLGDDEKLIEIVDKHISLAIGIGFVTSRGAQIRAGIMSQIPVDCLATITHPNATVSPSSRVDQGVFVAAGAIIGTGARLDVGVLVNSAAVVEHHCHIGRNSHVATGAHITGAVTTGCDVLIGAGAVVRQGLSIGDSAVIGAGSVLLKNATVGTVWIGHPARQIELET